MNTGLLLALLEAGLVVGFGIYAFATRKDRLLLASIALLLSFVSSSSFNNATAAILGFSALWPIILLSGFVIHTYFKLDPFRYSLAGRWIWIPLAIAIIYLFCVWPWFLYSSASLRRALAYLLVFLIGWFIVGRAITKDQDRIYETIRTIVLVIALVGFAQALVEFFLSAGSLTNIQEGNTTQIGSLEVRRLKATIHFTGLGYMLVLAFFGQINLGQRTNRSWVKKLSYGTMPVSFSLLLLTGSRGPLLTFFVLILVYLGIVFLNKSYNRKTRTIAFVALLTIIVLPFILWGTFVKPYILARLPVEDLDEFSLIKVFYYSRLSNIAEIVLYALELGYNPILGAGPKASILIAESGWLLSDFPIESYIPRMIFEWGIVGGLLYIFSTLMILWETIRLEAEERRAGDRTAWLLTIYMLIPWISSITSYGLSTVDGNLILVYAIGAAASTANILRKKEKKKIASWGTNG